MPSFVPVDVADLASNDLHLTARLASASNQVFAGSLNTATGEVPVIYKPISGERPLWDFPGATLAVHEVLTFEIDSLLGWGLVPPTVLRLDAPFGSGVLQQYVPAPVTNDVAVVPASQHSDGWVVIVQGVNAEDEPVQLRHRRSRRLQMFALVDAMCNNTDRKASHLLGDGDEVYGIDHGLCFHAQDKLRTVVWGFAGQQIPADLHADLLTLSQTVVGSGAFTLLTAEAQEATQRRLANLVATAEFPVPHGNWPALPSPLW